MDFETLLQENCKDERQFMHDIASPIGTALFLVDAAIDNLKGTPGIVPEDLTQLQQALKALMRVKDMMAERRRVLMERGAQAGG